MHLCIAYAHSMYKSAGNMQKTRRQELIRDLISGHSISRQDELARLLTEKGFSVTQASVSRDLDDLGVSKVNGRYSLRTTNGRRGEYGVVSLATAGDNLIIIKCGSGLASAAAVRIDAAGISEIVGTIAGDDTIFVAVKGVEERETALSSLRSILETNKRNAER